MLPPRRTSGEHSARISGSFPVENLCGAARRNATADDRENPSLVEGNALAALAIAILFLLTLIWAVLVGHGVWGLVSWILE